MIKFTETQHRAIHHWDTPIVISGVSGSGKSTVLAHKVACAIEEFPDTKVAVLCGSSSLSQDLRAWVGNVVGIDVLNAEFTRLELLALRWLRSHAALAGLSPHFTVFDSIERLRVAVDILSAPTSDGISRSPRELLMDIRSKKQLSTDPFSDNHALPPMFKTYQRYLDDSNAIDVDDILPLALRLVDNHPELKTTLANQFPIWMIDQGEDLSVVATEFVIAMASSLKHVTIVGDPLQRIGIGVGNDTDAISSLTKLSSFQSIELSPGFNKNNAISETISSFKQPSKHDPLVVYDAADSLSYFLAHDDVEELDYIRNEIDGLRRNHLWSLNDFAILYRSPSQAVAIEEQLRLHAIRFRNLGRTGVYGHSEIRDLVLYLRLLVNPSDRQALAQLLSIAPFQLADDEISRVVSLMPTTSDGVFELTDIDSLPDSVQPKIVGLVDLLTHWENELKDNPDMLAGAILDNIARDSGYRMILDEDNTLESMDQLQSIDDFIDTAIDQNWSIEDILNQVTLQQMNDDTPQSGEAISLIPLDSAKGRRFRCVMISGFEEGLIPQRDAIDHPEWLEQERRFVYLGLSRATHHLVLTSALQRTFISTERLGDISRFVADIPRHRLAGFVSSRVLETHPVLVDRLRSDGYHIEEWSPTAISSVSVSDTSYTVGEWVDHPTWGKGIVQSVEGHDGNTMLHIQFPDQIRKIMAKYADLIRL